jgi:hypothetical protein
LTLDAPLARRTEMGRWCKSCLTGLAVVGLIAAAWTTAWCAAAKKVGTLAEIVGSVEILHLDDKEFRTARLYEEILEKDKIRTGPGARAKVLYDDDSMTVLAENTSIEIREYQLSTDRKRTQSVIGLLQGKLRFIVTKYLAKDKSNFVVQTPTAVMGVRGSDSVAVFEGDTSTAYHLFGDLEITSSKTGEKLTITSGQWCIVHPDGSMERGAITADQLQQILNFFAKLTPAEQRRYKDDLEKELRQQGLDVILPTPDRAPGQFIKPPEPPQQHHYGHHH